MEIEYDKKKNEENITKHNISFEKIFDFDFDNCVTKIDERFEYGEIRLISYGTLNDRLHILVWTRRNNKIRPISFRKANKKERKQYEK
jgi:uncharacterized DUF497 family protein